MKVLLPKRPNQNTSQPTTFGQKRAEDFARKYKQSVEKRKNLRRAEYAAKAVPDQELAKTYKIKGEMLGRDLGRMQDQKKLDDDSDAAKK